ncbi:MAG: glycosyltransferase [Planctomycetota bacterium]
MSSEHTVIVTSYNQPTTLRLVLEGLRRQSELNFDVAIADDGSDPDTKEMLDEFAVDSPFDIRFCTQEDKGFRKSRALNNAIRMSDADYYYFLDGDCIPQQHWLRRYRRAFRRGFDFSTSTYITLDLETTKALAPAQVADGSFERFATSDKLARARRAHARQLFYRAIFYRRARIRGGNWACSAAALEAVNGFDENFENFGKEDSDIRNRLINAGFRPLCQWSTNWAAHCHHDVDPRRVRPEVQRKAPDLEYYVSRKTAKLCQRGLRNLDAPSSP